MCLPRLVLHTSSPVSPPERPICHFLPRFPSWIIHCYFPPMHADSKKPVSSSGGQGRDALRPHPTAATATAAFSQGLASPVTQERFLAKWPKGCQTHRSVSLFLLLPRSFPPLMACYSLAAATNRCPLCWGVPPCVLRCCRSPRSRAPCVALWWKLMI